MSSTSSTINSLEDICQLDFTAESYDIYIGSKVQSWDFEMLKEITPYDWKKIKLLDLTKDSKPPLNRCPVLGLPGCVIPCRLKDLKRPFMHILKEMRRLGLDKIDTRSPKHCHLCKINRLRQPDYETQGNGDNIYDEMKSFDKRTVDNKNKQSETIDPIRYTKSSSHRLLAGIYTMKEVIGKMP